MRLKRRRTAPHKKGHSVWRRHVSLHPRLDRFHGTKAVIFLSVLIGIVILLPFIAHKVPNILGLTDETSIYFPENITVNPGVPFDVPVMLTAIDSTVGIDLVASFDPTKLELVDVIPQVSTSVFGTFAPMTPTGVFDSSIVISRANSNGSIMFSAIAYDKASSSFQVPFSGQLNQAGPLALLRFRPLVPAASTVSLTGTAGRTNDSNVASANTGADILVNVAPIQVAVSNTPIPTATAAPTQTLTPTPRLTNTPTPTFGTQTTPTVTTRPTNTPTTRPTNTPAPQPTQTPAPTPPGGGVVAYAVTASGNDVNQDGSRVFDTSGKTLWLGSASTTSSVTGLRFTDVSIPRNSQIVSAKLRLHVPQPTWIQLNLQVAAENVGNSREFRNNAKPAGRTLTSAKVMHGSNIQWQGGEWIMLDEMAPVIQEVIQRSDWNAGNALSVIIKNTSTQLWARKFVTSFDGDPSKAPQLVISYIPAANQPIPTPTQPSAPTATPNPAATATPVPTPTSASAPTNSPTTRPTSTPTTRPTNTPTTRPTSTSTPTPVPVSNILTNASFDSGLSGWNIGWAVTASSDAHSGGTSAKINENGDYLSQNLEGKLTAGKTYTFTAYVKVLTQGTSWGLPSFRLSRYADLGTNEYGVADAANSTGAGWQKLTFSKSFTSAQINSGLYLGVKHFGFDGVTVVDNFTVTEQ